MPQLIVPYRFIAHSPASSVQMNANFTAVANFYNGNLSSDNLANNAITSGKITADSLDAENFNDDSVTAAKIIDDTVVHSNIANDQIIGTHFWPVAAASNFPAYRVSQNNNYWPTILPGTIPSVTFPGTSSGDVYFETGAYSFSSILDGSVSEFPGIPGIPIVLKIGIVPDTWANNCWSYPTWSIWPLSVTSTSISLRVYGKAPDYGNMWSGDTADIDILLMWITSPLPCEL